LLRKNVSDRRMQFYGREKVDDYTFRLGDSGMVIDTTRKGGVARYGARSEAKSKKFASEATYITNNPSHTLTLPTGT